MASSDATKHNFSSKINHGDTLASSSFSMVHCCGRSVLANITKAFVAFICTLDVHETPSLLLRCLCVDEQDTGKQGSITFSYVIKATYFVQLSTTYVGWMNASQPHVYSMKSVIEFSLVSLLTWVTFSC